MVLLLAPLRNLEIIIYSSVSYGGRLPIRWDFNSYCALGIGAIALGILYVFGSNPKRDQIAFPVAVTIDAMLVLFGLDTRTLSTNFLKYYPYYLIDVGTWTICGFVSALCVLIVQKAIQEIRQ